MLVLVVSDFHLGKGKFLKNGELNILEDFFEDDRFKEFLEFHSSGVNYFTHIHLVLNGDILNLIQVDNEGIFGHVVDDEVTVKALDKIAAGHPLFFESLKSFLSAPNKEISYVVGNHDAGMAFEGAQKRFSELVGGKVKFAHAINLHGVHIEHGHRFEALNHVPEEIFFMQGPRGKKILNLPWGSLFCLNVLPGLKKERPYIDKIRPMSAYVKWCLLHDFPFFIRMSLRILRYYIQTNFSSYNGLIHNFKTNLQVVKQVTIYPKYEKMARSILRKHPEKHTVVMGHTHLLEWRRFPEGKYYFNTGTWNPIPSMDIGQHEHMVKLAYVSIDINAKTSVMKQASLNIWQGKWRPFREEVSTN